QDAVGEPVQAVLTHGEQAEHRPGAPVEQLAGEQFRADAGRAGQHAAQVQPPGPAHPGMGGEELGAQPAADAVGRDHRVRLQDGTAPADDGHAAGPDVEALDRGGGPHQPGGQRRTDRPVQFGALDDGHRPDLLLRPGRLSHEQRAPAPVAQPGPYGVNALRTDAPRPPQRAEGAHPLRHEHGPDAPLPQAGAPPQQALRLTRSTQAHRPRPPRSSSGPPIHYDRTTTLIGNMAPCRPRTRPAAAPSPTPPSTCWRPPACTGSPTARSRRRRSSRRARRPTTSAAGKPSWSRSPNASPNCTTPTPATPSNSPPHWPNS